jgi:hypothetical protein
MTIDTLEYVKKLEAAGVDRKVAEVHASLLRDVVEAEVATKRDVDDAANRLETQLGARVHKLEVDLGAHVRKLEVDFEKLNAKVQLLTWMVGFNLAATMAVLWKLLR